MIDIKLDNDALLPVRAHKADAGIDLLTPVDVVIKANASATIDTGVHMAIPEGFFGKLESKSGLNVNHNVVCLGGVIDSGYTGSIKVKLYNLGDEPMLFKRGNKVVQMIIQPCLLTDFCVVDKLENTERGENGFGSTGE